jgi:hypothetical protein
MLLRSLEARGIIHGRRLAELSVKGDGLERLNHHVDFEASRRPPSDQLFMLKVLNLQASHKHSDERTEYLINNRISFMRLLGSSPNGTVPDANTILTFREKLWLCVTCCVWVVIVAGSAAGSRVLNLPFDKPGRPSEESSSLPKRWDRDDNRMIAGREFERSDVGQCIDRLKANCWIVNPYRRVRDAKMHRHPVLARQALPPND